MIIIIQVICHIDRLNINHKSRFNLFALIDQQHIICMCMHCGGIERTIFSTLAERSKLCYTSRLCIHRSNAVNTMVIVIYTLSIECNYTMYL